MTFLITVIEKERRSNLSIVLPITSAFSDLKSENITSGFHPDEISGPDELCFLSPALRRHDEAIRLLLYRLLRQHLPNNS